MDVLLLKPLNLTAPYYINYYC